MREHHFELSSVNVDAASLTRFDAIVLTTDHDAFDYELIAKHGKLIIDCRGKYRAPAPHIVKA
jgi:UDP-N-acetyl-D-glucosamine dehydrogenase